MKRFFPIFAAVALTASLLHAQEGATTTSAAAEFAARQEAEERDKRIVQALEDLMASQSALQRRLAEALQEIDRLKGQVAEAESKNSRFATKEDLQRLADALKEIDQKREADKKLILDELQKLAKMPAPVVTPKETTPAVTPTGPMEGYDYTIQSGDTLSTVLAAYNEEFRKQGLKTVSLNEVVRANPGLNPNRVTVGMKIFIPAPGK
jgi:hypothetical protein